MGASVPPNMLKMSKSVAAHNGLITGLVFLSSLLFFLFPDVYFVFFDHLKVFPISLSAPVLCVCHLLVLINRYNSIYQLIRWIHVAHKDIKQKNMRWRESSAEL